MQRLFPLLLLATSCSAPGSEVWVDVQGARVHARVVGPSSAPVVVLNSGAGQDLEVWEEVAEELAADGIGA